MKEGVKHKQHYPAGALNAHIAELTFVEDHYTGSQLFFDQLSPLWNVTILLRPIST